MDQKAKKYAINAVVIAFILFLLIGAFWVVG